MRRTLAMTFVLACTLVVGVSAQTLVLSRDFTQSGPATPSYGDWAVNNGRLYQNNVYSPLAKINLAASQSGIMQYAFNVRYEGGGEDRKGGFGIEVYIDNAFDGRSWGDGHSYLLWLNYDEHPTYGGAGFRAQVYRSTSPTDMTLMPGYDIALDPSYLTQDNLSMVVPVTITINSDTGDVTVKDPTRDNWEYAFNLGAAPGSGSYIALRTNSLAVSFGNLTVTQLQ